MFKVVTVLATWEGDSIRPQREVDQVDHLLLMMRQSIKPTPMQKIRVRVEETEAGTDNIITTKRSRCLVASILTNRSRANNSHPS